MEGDFGNSKYWFCRVGHHACFPEIARRLTQDDGLQKDDLFDIAPGAGSGQWDPVAFVDYCQRADEKGGKLLEIKNQVALHEWSALFEYCWSHAHA